MMWRQSNNHPPRQPDPPPPLLALALLQGTLKLIYISDLASNSHNPAVELLWIQESESIRLANVLAGYVFLFGVAHEGGHGAEKEEPADTWRRDYFHESHGSDDCPAQA